MNIRPTLGIALASLLFGIGMFAAATPASAHNNAYPWGRCDQKTKLMNSNIRVSESPTRPFPQNGTGGGVVNSYYNRLGESIAEWNKALRAPEGSGVIKSFQYVGRTATTDVMVGYGFPSDFPVPDGTGMTTTVLGVCGTVHPTNGRIQMPYPSGYPWIPIYVADVPDWFTQEESERKKWEQYCDGTLAGTPYNAYSCSKTTDAGSAFVHELGHVMGFRDIKPTLVDHLRASGVSRPEYVIGLDGKEGARCGLIRARPKNTGEMATMCTDLPPYVTAGRTLAPYDFATLRLNLQ